MSLYTVYTNLEKPTLDISAFEKALKYHHDRDNMVKGIVIINPHNPLGVVFDQDQVIRLCNWAASQNLYVIIDEIFANSVFDPKANFKSFLCYYKKLARPDHVAYMWGFSKDYGVPGFKFAVIHSTSPTLRAVLGKLEYYSPVSCLVQDFAVKFLADNEWLQNYHKTLKHRLAVHYNFTVKHFKEMRIPYVPAQGGFCVFADFSEMLKSKTSKAELELWRKVATGGVMLTPGDHQKCLKPGWFRLVFACTKEELQEGIRRLYKLTRNIDNPNIEPIREVKILNGSIDEDWDIGDDLLPKYEHAKKIIKRKVDDIKIVAEECYDMLKEGVVEVEHNIAGHLQNVKDVVKEKAEEMLHGQSKRSN
ncbi:unnamed protein product [Caenorhabditis auriculariae]|uniref:Aminotransferase class I/classII large domain-containing protein n=1 Tax=Caenorhabditis auriculariae TaxID=2777116 RepID=A0A8S1HTW8_9PELO|nr:unnamed protein product [Caenorhabditis auriculariae]